MAELESVSGEKNLSRISPPVNMEEQERTVSQADSAGDKWDVVSGKNNGLEIKQLDDNTDGCLSPNGFQVLQDLREEGEIEDDDNDEVSAKEVDDDGSKLAQPVSSNLPPLAPSGAFASNALAVSTGTASPPRQGSSLRNKGRGSKKTIVNSRGLVQAVTHQQKGSNATKKASYRKL
ncbi:zf-CCHC_4 domain-containing protein [Raphanus sativus]|nr:zf-CCHC_4 domain-containing protein [Raphanus sativus]